MNGLNPITLNAHILYVCCTHAANSSKCLCVCTSSIILRSSEVEVVLVVVVVVWEHIRRPARIYYNIIYDTLIVFFFF